MTDLDNGVPIEHYKGWGCALGLGFLGFIALISLGVSQQVLGVAFFILFPATAVLCIAELNYQSEHREE